MVFLEYLYWHFSIAPKKIWEIAANYMAAGWHRFLIVQHLKSLFSPWHRRLPSDFGRPKDAGDRMINFVTDFYIRIVAAIIRLSIIATGLVYELAIFIFFTAGFFIWVLWPVVVVLSVGRGLHLISGIF